MNTCSKCGAELDMEGKCPGCGLLPEECACEKQEAMDMDMNVEEPASDSMEDLSAE